MKLFYISLILLSSCSQNRNEIILHDHVPVIITSGPYAGCSGIILTGDQSGLVVDTECERNSVTYRFVRIFKYNELEVL